MKRKDVTHCSISIEYRIAVSFDKILDKDTGLKMYLRYSSILKIVSRYSIGSILDKILEYHGEQLKRVLIYFLGVTGNVSINGNGDRNADYALLDMDPTTGDFRVCK